MHKPRDVSHMVDHPYFRGLEERHEKGTGLELALQEMAARRRKSAELRAARETAQSQQED